MNNVTQINTKIDLSKYISITQEYEKINCNTGELLKKKISYLNPDNYKKTLFLETTDPLLELVQKKIEIESHSSKYIKLRFNIPQREGFYYVYLIIRNLRNQNQIEEIEKFHFNAGK